MPVKIDPELLAEMARILKAAQEAIASQKKWEPQELAPEKEPRRT